jgi:hypothetical protein
VILVTGCVTPDFLPRSNSLAELSACITKPTPHVNLIKVILAPFTV